MKPRTTMHLLLWFLQDCTENNFGLDGYKAVCSRQPCSRKASRRQPKRVCEETSSQYFFCLLCIYAKKRDYVKWGAITGGIGALAKVPTLRKIRVMLCMVYRGHARGMPKISDR